MRFGFGEPVEVDEPVDGVVDPWTGEPVEGGVVTTPYNEGVFVYRDEATEDERADRTTQVERYSVFFDDRWDVSISRRAVVRLRGVTCKADGPCVRLKHPLTGWEPVTVLKCVRVEG